MCCAAYNNEQVWISGGVAVTPAWKPYNVTNSSWPVVFNENAVSGDDGHGAFVYANYTSWEPVRCMCLPVRLRSMCAR